jgi:hypothetical protein
VRASVLDTATESVVAATTLSSSGAVHAEHPALVGQVEGYPSWTAVWQEEAPGSARRQVVAAVVLGDGFATDGFVLGTAGELTKYALRPRIDGGSGRYETDGARYPVAWADTSQVRGSHLLYPAVAAPRSHGTACGGLTIGYPSSHGSQPYAGNARFEVHVGGPSASASCALLVGVATAHLPLPGGCALHIAPLAVLPFATVGSTAEVPLPLPSIQGGAIQLQAVAATFGGLALSSGFEFTLVR